MVGRRGYRYHTVLGMLAFELNNRDFRRIWLFYVVRDEQEAVYDSEIRESYLEAESYIDYTLWLTGSRGRITAAQVAAEIAPLEGYAVMLCGQVRFISASLDSSARSAYRVNELSPKSLNSVSRPREKQISRPREKQRGDLPPDWTLSRCGR
jgi:ferredoxin-NADP reductase